MKKILLTAIGFVFIFVTACNLQFPLFPNKIEVEITTPRVMSRGLVPEIDTAIAYYEITYAHEDGDSVTVTTESASHTKENAVAGTWTITVLAYNAVDVLIASGEKEVTINHGDSVSVNITLGPIAGPGSLAVDVLWPTAEIVSPSLEGTLVPVDGDPVDLTFQYGAEGTASYNDTEIEAGFYTLTVKLYDYEQLAGGAVELVQILQGYETAGSYDFSDPNLAGDLDVTIAPCFDACLEVTVTGYTVPVTYGTPVTLTASTTGTESNVVYTWYCNGETLDTGVDSVTISNKLPGTYRIDTIALTADGLYGGSATTTITIQE
jgi:hypothetical protein